MKQEFLDRMKELLQEEYPQFERSLQEELCRGVRINPLKIREEDFLSLFPYEVKHTSFCREGFYLSQTAAQVGNHPLHLAGAIYLQEPSASAPVEVLGVEQGDFVLDLCAAPGGKSTQLAAKLANSGTLIANEYDPKRARILLSNMERMGFGEVIITNAHPSQLEKQWEGWFDKILVDAPCSGEGMMKKHDAAAEEWSQAHVCACGDRQVQILHSAFAMLKESGILVYSTCTYAKEENEMVVSRILKERDDIEQMDLPVSFGRCGYACTGMDHTKVRRIFPMDGGEGHFIAKFQKKKAGKTARQKMKKPAQLSKEQRRQIAAIWKEKEGYYDIVQDKLYFRFQPFVEMGAIHVLRQGILCGSFVKNRFEPHQHLFVSTAFFDSFLQVYACDEEQWVQFQRGEELSVRGYHGYVAIAWHSLIVGFGKGDGTVIKNKYPKGLRRQ